MDQKISRRRAAKLAGAAMLAPFVLSATRGLRAAETKIRFSLPWIPHGGYAFAFVAKNQGFWKKRGLDVQVDRGFGSGETCKRVALGQYDFGLADFGTMVKSAGGGLPLMSVAMVSHVSQIGILSLKKSNITKPKDLEGKKIGTTAGSADFALWPGFVAATGIDGSKVDSVFMGPELRHKSLLEGQVDAIGAVYGSDAPTFLARGEDYNLLLYASYGLELYSNALVTVRERVKNDPKLVQNFVDGTMEGLKFSFLEPEKTVDIHLEEVKEYEGASTDRDMIKYGVMIGTATALADYLKQRGLGWTERKLVEGTQEKLVKYLGLKDPQDVDTLFTNDFAGKIKLSEAEWAKVYETVKPYIL